MASLALPIGWLNSELVERYCVENDGNGKKRLTTAVIDSPVLYLKFRQELYPNLKTIQYRGALRRLCFDHGAGYRPSPFHANLRSLLTDRMNELNRKTWPCFKAPTAEQQSQVDDTPLLKTIMTSPHNFALNNSAEKPEVGDTEVSSSGSDATASSCQGGGGGVGVSTAGASAAGASTTGASAAGVRSAGASVAGVRSADASVAGASAAGVSAAGASAAGASEHDYMSAFEPRAFLVDDEDSEEEGVEEEEEEYGNNKIDPALLDMLHEFANETTNDGNNEDEDTTAAIEQMNRLKISVFENFTSTVWLTENHYQALERHYTSCFKYPELVGFMLVPKRYAQYFLPYIYANKQAIRLFGTDVTKEYHQGLTASAIPRAAALMSKIMVSKVEPWILHTFVSMTLNCFEENGAKCLRALDMWISTELFNDDHFVKILSPAGENELLRQPGPFRPDGLV